MSLIRWCEVHRAAESAEDGECEVAARIINVPGPYPRDDYPTACRLVEMRLTPKDTLVVERDVDGLWPDWAYEAASQRLANVGGTDQWENKSYRMAYAAVVFRALDAAWALREAS
jgi:hypothetical protein